MDKKELELNIPKGVTCKCRKKVKFPLNESGIPANIMTPCSCGKIFYPFSDRVGVNLEACEVVGSELIPWEGKVLF